MRSPKELKRAASILCGAEAMFETHGIQMPKLPQTQLTLMQVALEWASGKDNLMSELIAGIEEACYIHGIGVTEDGKPYTLNPVVVQ